ncbi:uncharacterized protein CDV56_101510 [Aspergillus thermomutatus]|uniref:Uncharacterized protein n=1 Tax=Aspergillus thermomutatus TaxID=41047 RepID=A0A397G1D5_ASPTH|nr:uncharacterized protein CDV56_101510 [Aspergillus thermomutatus]RHZ43634.1 hypothetical protein CDV56_101510 [Aspergillus thermomutatus]
MGVTQALPGLINAFDNIEQSYRSHHGITGDKKTRKNMLSHHLNAPRTRWIDFQQDMRKRRIARNWELRVIKYLHEHHPDTIVDHLDARDIQELERLVDGANQLDEDGKIDAWDMGLMTKLDLIPVQHKTNKKL